MFTNASFGRRAGSAIACHGSGSGGGCWAK